MSSRFHGISFNVFHKIQYCAIGIKLGYAAQLAKMNVSVLLQCREHLNWSNRNSGNEKVILPTLPFSGLVGSHFDLVKKL